ncbi:MAG: 2-phospho-L-lactate transferase [Ectothiorhodospiraceae bacterium AqS1]|nr:2-phospho-L-lactate transferase [Ectothiorhodospiraceae bacterium AqS1]
MGEAAQGIPAVFLRGLEWSAAPTCARSILRDPERDLFRPAAIDLPLRGAAGGVSEPGEGNPGPESAGLRDAAPETDIAAASISIARRTERVAGSDPPIGSVVALSGGIGGAKLALGLYRVLPPDSLTVIANPGDDFDLMGLRICPDSDTLLYTLAGIADPDTGWGRAGESWGFMQALSELGGEDWFSLGDKDLALHVERTRRLQAGEGLCEITSSFARRLGLRAKIVHACDEPLRTVVRTDKGRLEFQRYFVGEGCAPCVHGFDFEGADEALPTPAALAALASPDLECIVICPSNPFISIDPIFCVPGLRQAIRNAGVPVIGISPIIEGESVKGPTAKMMRELGLCVSNRSIEEHYGDRVDAWIIDSADERDRREFRRPVCVAKIRMRDLADRESLARTTLDFAARIRAERIRAGIHRG